MNTPPAVRTDSGSLLTTDREGRQRWRAEWTMQQVESEGEAMVRFTERGSGRYSPFTQPVRWQLEAYWTLEPRYAPARYEKTVSDLEGNVLVTERRTFDWREGTVHFQRIDREGDRDVDQVLRVPEDTLTAEGLAVALRHLPFESPRPVRAHFLSDEPKLYPVTFRIKGREVIDIPEGSTDCYTVRMDFDLGLLNLFKAFIPETTLWFAAAAPHRWVRSRGLESGRGTPVVIRTAQSGL